MTTVQPQAVEDRQIGDIIDAFRERNDLAEIIGLQAELAEAYGDDTVLNVVCDKTGCHLHVTTFAIGDCCKDD